MKRTLHFAWLTALVGVVFANHRRKTVATPEHHCVWFVRPGGHHVVDDTSSRIAVQPEPRLGRIPARRREEVPSPTSR